jgi:hypothetical protein
MRATLSEADQELPIFEVLRKAVIEFNRFPQDELAMHRSRMWLLLNVPTLMAHSTLRYAEWRQVIAEFVANRSQVGQGAETSPGSANIDYFTPMTYTPKAAGGGLMSLAGGGMSNLGSYSDGGRLLRGPGDGVSDSIPATIGGKQPARLATGEFVVPARIVSELGNGSTEAGAKKLYAMMDRVQKARRKTKNVAADTKAHKYLPA